MTNFPANPYLAYQRDAKTNRVERTRLRAGLAVQQMLELLHHSDEAIFRLPENEIPQHVLLRADRINDAYTIWHNQVIANICEYEEDTLFSPRQAASLLGISEFQLTAVRKRGEVAIAPQERKPSAHAYTPGALRDLVTYNSEALPAATSKVRGPLAAAFLSWFERFVRS